MNTVSNCNISGPVISLTATDNECSENGTIQVSITGGNGSVMISIEPYPGASFSNNVYSGLPADTYTIEARDEDNCSSSASIDLALISYSNDIFPIIDKYCSLANCHDGSNANVPNWGILANVQDGADKIKERTSALSMPPAGQDPLGREEITAITCWVDQGAMDN